MKGNLNWKSEKKHKWLDFMQDRWVGTLISRPALWENTLAMRKLEKWCILISLRFKINCLMNSLFFNFHFEASFQLTKKKNHSSGLNKRLSTLIIILKYSMCFFHRFYSVSLCNTFVSYFKQICIFCHIKISRKRICFSLKLLKYLYDWTLDYFCRDVMLLCKTQQEFNQY